jgi:hypothetical protein
MARTCWGGGRTHGTTAPSTSGALETTEASAAMEYSTFHHHLWVLRSRHGAWDHPSRSYPKFVTCTWRRTSPTSACSCPRTGWWAFRAGSRRSVSRPSRGHRVLVCQGPGDRLGLSLQGYDLNATGPAASRAIVKQYEELRHAGYFPEPSRHGCVAGRGVHARARRGRRLEDAASVHQTVRLLRPRGRVMEVTNPHAAQAPSVRIEALMSVAPYDSPDGVSRGLH